MGRVGSPNTSVCLMDLAWRKGMKYNSTRRSQRILQKKSTNKRRVGNRAMVRSGMPRRNSGTGVSAETTETTGPVAAESVAIVTVRGG